MWTLAYFLGFRALDAVFFRSSGTNSFIDAEGSEPAISDSSMTDISLMII